MTTHRLSIIPGDGVGREVVPEGLKAVRAAAEVTGSFAIETVDYPWSCEYYAQHGRMMDGDAMDRMRDSDAIYLGAIGFPGVPDHVSLWTMLLPIRQQFDLYINLRPTSCSRASRARCAIGAPRTSTSSASARTPRASTAASAAGSGQGTPDEVVTQTAIFTRKGTERVVRYAFDLAMKRKKQLVSCTKSNALNYSMVFWDEVVAEVGKEYPEVERPEPARRRAGGALRAQPAAARRRRRQQPVRRHPDRPRRRAPGLAGPAGLGQHRPDRQAPEPVRARPRLGARAGRQGDSPTRWPPSGGLDDARAAGRAEAAALVIRAASSTSRSTARETMDLGGEAKTPDIGDAVEAFIRSTRD